MAKDMNNGAIVLCGGRSNRMGRDKATLPFGPECMLQRVVRLLAEVVELSKIVVVAAAGQNAVSTTEMGEAVLKQLQKIAG